MSDQKPPIFKSWSSWYWLVLAVMAAQVLIFFLVTRIFS
jgi:hypothetical protein